MKVKIVSYSVPTAEIAEMGVSDLQELIAFCARVSNPSNQFNSSSSKKLLEYLLDHQHFSPFEMVNVCLEIETTRDIGRQILRHKSFGFQEFSQRYADPTKDMSFVIREARLQDPKNRQNSIEMDGTLAAAIISDEWRDRQIQCINLAKETYEWAISKGIAKEQARAVLPEGNTVSRIYINGTLRSWVHWMQLRSGNGTQKEHMEIAFACAEVISKIFPMAKDIVVPKV